MQCKAKWIIFITVVVLTILLQCFALSPYHIPSSGMENSLYDGEQILVNKWSYGLRLPFMSLSGYHRLAAKPLKREDIIVFNNPGNLSQQTIDRKEVFIGRCIGLPGDTLIVDSLYSSISPDKSAPDQKFLYTYPRAKEKQLDSLMHILAIRGNKLLGQDSIKCVRSFSRYEYYLLKQALQNSFYITLLSNEDSTEAYHPLIIPGKGKAIRVYPWNRTLLRNTLVLHEHKRAEIKHDTLFVEGKAVQHCYFTKNYYWVSTSSSINLSDSRLFGFVPEDHIIGKAWLIWFSKEKNSGVFNGFRWKRFFSKVQ